MSGKTVLAAATAVALAGGATLAQPSTTPAVSEPAHPSMDPAGEPPRRLSCRIGHKDYHSSYARVGVRLNGDEVRNLEWYDVDTLQVKFAHRTGIFTVKSIEPFWRYPETRQMRRARERWEAKQTDTPK